MDEQFINDILEKLKNGELSEYRIEKEHFLSFRTTLVNREDFKQFRGIAQHNGAIIYQYLQHPRS